MWIVVDEDRKYIINEHIQTIIDKITNNMTNIDG